MALVSRSVRRGGTGRRWVFAAIGITVLVLLIDASLHSRSPGPGTQLKSGAWVDRALPIVTTSTEEGQQLAAIWSGGLQMPVTSLTAQLNEIVSGAEAAYRQAVALRPPNNLAGPAGLLDATLLSRSDAVTQVRDALAKVLPGSQSTDGPNGSASVIVLIQSAGEDLQIGDRTYNLFLANLPDLGVTMPQSAWGQNLAPYQRDTAQAFVASLQSATSSTPVHQVRIDSITTSPSLVSSIGKVQVLPAAPAMTVTVVLSDTGNQPENNLTVTAAITSGTENFSVQDFVSLTPGQSRTVQNMGPLNPPQGVDVRLVVTVKPPAGSPTPSVSRTVEFIMPANTPPTTTTVPASPPST